MSNLCTCDHLKQEHWFDLGLCSGDCIDPQTGEMYACICVRFEDVAS